MTGKNKNINKRSKFKIIFWMAIFLGPFNQAQAEKCKEAFSYPHSPSDFAKTMSKGLQLDKNQLPLLEGYIKLWFNAKQAEYKKEIQHLFNILEKYPELSKPTLREYQLVFFQKEEKKSESLIHFLKSFNSSAGRIKNNLFQIEANWGLWAKALSFTSTDKNKSREEEKQNFLEYLDTTPLNKELRQFIANSKNSEGNFESPVLDYKEKTIVFYQALSTLRENFQDDPKAFEFLSQAMSDIVHVSGFNSEFHSKLLKSKTPSENIKGIYNILSERDSISKELGFKEGFSELQSSLNIKHRDKFLEQLKTISEEIKNNVSSDLRETKEEIENNSVLRRKEVLRLRSLSLQEAPFRGCLGNDCSTTHYFNTALDPSYLYFTLTNDKHQSSGQITVILGKAKDKKNKSVKVAFVDKIQSVPTEKITAMLEGIRLSLKEEGYKLGLQKDVKKSDNLSNEIRIRNFVEYEVLPNLKTELLGFKSFKNKYNFKESLYSRANWELPLLEFDFYENKNSVEIHKGEKYLPKTADQDLSFKILYQPILSMKNSKKEEEQILFLNHLLMMNKLKELKVSNKNVEDHLFSLMKKPNLSLKLRKTAFFTLIQFKQSELENQINVINYMDFLKLKKSIFLLFENRLKSFSAKEKTLILGEMSNWKNSNEFYKRDFISKLHISALNNGVKGLEFLAHKSPWKTLFDVNTYTDIDYKRTMLHDSVNSTESALWLIKNGANVNTKDSYGASVLFSSIRNPKIVRELIKANVYINDVNKSGISPLMFATMTSGLDEKNSLDTIKILLSAGADPNIKSKDGNTALGIAAKEGYLEIVKVLIKAKANINEKDEKGYTPLMHSAMKGFLNIVSSLITAGADVNTVNKAGKTALMHAITYRRLKIITKLIMAGADPNIINKSNSGYSPLTEAVIHGNLQIVKKLISAGADINGVDYQGNTPLMHAIIHKKLKIAIALIMAGANLNIKNKNGDNVFTLLEKYQQPSLLKFINEKMYLKDKAQ